MAIQSPGTSDPNSSGNFSPISRMAGGAGSGPGGAPGAGGVGSDGPMGPSGSPMPAGGDPQQAMAAATETIRGIESAIEALSSQFPQIAPEARRAREAVRSLLMRIVANPGGAEPAAPSGPLG